MTKMVNDPLLFALMAKVWEENWTMSNLYYELKQQHQIDVYQTGERLLVFGQNRFTANLWEVAVAELVAIAPGVVVCNMLTPNANRYCTGVLERFGDVGGNYGVKTFHDCTGDDRVFSRANIDTDAKLIGPPTFAAVLWWGWGRSQGDNIGISYERWAVMYPWIEHWLGPQK